MRSPANGRLIARAMSSPSVWARSIASPSNSNTSDGGISTPSVLATATSAVRWLAVTPSTPRLEAVLRFSVTKLAPTEPLTGASNAPSSKPDSGAAARGSSGRSAWRRPPYTLPARSSRTNSAPTSP
jgi:hypothetical protein